MPARKEFELEERIEQKLRELFWQYVQVGGYLANEAYFDPSEEKPFEQVASLKAQMSILVELMDIPQEVLACAIAIVDTGYSEYENELERYIPWIEVWYQGNAGKFADLDLPLELHKKFRRPGDDDMGVEEIRQSK